MLLSLFVAVAMAQTPAETSGAKEIFVQDKVVFANDVEAPLKGKRIVAVLGSSRPASGTPIYVLTTKVVQALAAASYGIVTGGGPGIMDAANRAAFAAHVPSLGFDTKGFWKRQPTTFMDTLFIFKDLQVRKRELMQVSDAFIFMPGGLGTLDELFSVVGAIYSEQLPRKPVVLVDKKFWSPLLAVIRQTLVQDYKLADEKSFAMITVVDSPSEVLAALKK